MKVITCASYYGSGSSALTDLVGEYENVQNLSDLEIRFIHQLDGISDLEYHLVENHNRQNSGHALKRFASLMHFYEGNRISKQYSTFIDKERFRSLTEQYIDQLTQFKYTGWNFYDLYDKGVFIYYLSQLVNHFAERTNINLLKPLKREVTLCSHPTEDSFLSITRDYVHGILCELNPDNKEYLEVDQLVSSSNIERMLRYFTDEVYVFVVDRDPRDVFLLNKYCWNDHVAPKDVKKFCEWFKYAHEAGARFPKNNDHIMYIYFEDLIYRYDQMVANIEKKTGLSADMHSNQFSRMNPLRSIVNTRLWEQYDDSKDILYIEKSLSEFLYDYSNIDFSIVPGIKVSDNTLF